jgi:hypothetical protein
MTLCPVCSCDLSDTTPISTDEWNGHRRTSSQLVHIEGGERCLSDAEKPLSKTIRSLVQRGVKRKNAVTIALSQARVAQPQ